MSANVQARDIMECPECKGKTQIVVDYAQGSVGSDDVDGVLEEEQVRSFAVIVG